MVNQITISGRLTADPVLRYTPSGTAVASFTVAHSERKFDKATNQWVDEGDTLFLNVDCWKALAEGATESLVKGDPVTVTGKLRQENWEKNGEKKSRVKLVADEVATSVRAKRAAAPQQVESPW